MKSRITTYAVIFLTLLLSMFALAGPFTATATESSTSTATPTIISTPQSGAQGRFQIFLPVIEKAKVIAVENPGNHQNIQPLLQKAINRAAAGYTVVLPAGEFYVDGSVYINKFISLVGQGSGPGGTKLYRRETVSDATLSSNSWRFMMVIACDSNASSGVRVAGIHFQSKVPSEASGDGKSQATDYGILVRQCVDFLIEKNKFEYFGEAALNIKHKDAVARGVVAENEFFHNWRYKPGATDTRNFTTGYGVLVAGEDSTWNSDPKFGSSNFIFIEDNKFLSHRHSIAGGGTGLYVFRYNDVRDNFSQAIDAHGGGRYGNTRSTRAYEVYNNNVVNNIFVDSNGLPTANRPSKDPCASLARNGIKFRGGEGLAYGNKIQGFRNGIALQVEVSGTYPVYTQIGYQDGDVYMWNNQVSPYPTLTCAKLLAIDTPSLLVEGRDYHQNVVKPGYTAYPYPHPLRSPANFSALTETLN